MDKDFINIQDIIPDREIIKMQNEDLWGIYYESWRVSLPVYSDQVERLLENGFMVSMLENDKVTIQRKLHPTPDNLHQNKRIWNQISDAINTTEQSRSNQE